ADPAEAALDRGVGSDAGAREIVDQGVRAEHVLARVGAGGAAGVRLRVALLPPRKQRALAAGGTAAFPTREADDDAHRLGSASRRARAGTRSSRRSARRRPAPPRSGGAGCTSPSARRAPERRS